MKALLIAVLLSPLPVISHESNYSYSEGDKCFKRVYKEEYIPGNYLKPGYVQSWQEDIIISCHNNRASITNDSSIPKTKKCNETIGALTGGGIAASISAVDAYGWSIPLGLVLGKGIANADC